MSKVARVLVPATLVALLALLSGQPARAVSGGGYDPSQQDCPADADSTSQPKQTTVAGCHAFKLNVEDSTGRRYAEFGIDQLPDGYESTPGLFGVGVPGSPNFPHSGCMSANTNGTGGGTGTGCGDNSSGLGFALTFDTEDLTRNSITPEMGRIDFGMMLARLLMGGTHIYLGADDNLDAGEHDGASGKNGTNKSINGPSDGGAVQVFTSPGDLTNTPTLAEPLTAAGVAFGSCADGICEEITTFRQALYHGGKGSDSRDVSDYSAKQWDPYGCSSGSQREEQECRTASHKDMNDWRSSEAGTVYAEPGVQIYEDPDAQASPIDPFYDGGLYADPMLYPLVGFYAGTCGVTLGGGPLLPGGTLPGSTSAGQVLVPTGC